MMNAELHHLIHKSDEQTEHASSSSATKTNRSDDLQPRRLRQRTGPTEAGEATYPARTTAKQDVEVQNLDP